MITQDKLKSLFTYNKETGVILWNSRERINFKTQRSFNTWNSRFYNKQAGNKCSDGYIRIRIDSKAYLSHRLIWLLIYGFEPEQIDHINGNKSDNRLCNLRNVNHTDNLRNCPISKNNSSGIIGVSFNSRDSKWLVQIGSHGKTITIGYVYDFFVACCLRKSKENELGYHKNHGRKIYGK